jgi:hypothetical protein
MRTMKQSIIRLLGGQALANLAGRLSSGDYGERLEGAYRALVGRKRIIGYLLYIAGYAAAATATVLGCAGESTVPGCAWAIASSQVVTWLGWGLMELGVLDAHARAPGRDVPIELAAAASHQTIILALVYGSALVAQAVGVPEEVCGVFVDEILLITLAQVGLLAPQTTAALARPRPLPAPGFRSVV